MKHRKRISTEDIEVIPSKVVKTEELTDSEGPGPEKEPENDENPVTVKTEYFEEVAESKASTRKMKAEVKKSKVDKNASGDSTKNKEKKKIDEVIGMNKLVANIKDKKTTGKNLDHALQKVGKIKRNSKNSLEFDTKETLVQKIPRKTLKNNDKKPIRILARKKITRTYHSEIEEENTEETSRISSPKKSDKKDNVKKKELKNKLTVPKSSSEKERNNNDDVTMIKKKPVKKILDKDEGAVKSSAKTFLEEENVMDQIEGDDFVPVELKQEKSDEIKTVTSSKITRKTSANKNRIGKNLNKEDKSTETLVKKNLTALENMERIDSDGHNAKQKREEHDAKASEGLHKKLGAHVSIAGGLKNAVLNAVEIGAKSFAMFLKSQRQWAAKPLTDEEAEKFRDMCNLHGYPPHLILPHGSYLMNCGSPKQETLEKSRAALVDELKRCEKLGLSLFNFHPGSTCGEINVEECMDRIADSINQAHSQTKSVICVIENMSCQGNTLGGRFCELRGIIDRVKDKSRIGICLDTCHAFAAGYNLASEKGYDEMMEDFGKEIGFQYLKGMHINDSKGKVGCHLDRHENIGRGHIGKAGFKRIMEDSRLNNIPLVLETPCPEDDTYANEIKMLYKMCSD